LLAAAALDRRPNSHKRAISIQLLSGTVGEQLREIVEPTAAARAPSSLSKFMFAMWFVPRPRDITGNRDLPHHEGHGVVVERQAVERLWRLNKPRRVCAGRGREHVRLSRCVSIPSHG